MLLLPGLLLPWPPVAVVLALDAGTTGLRAMAFDSDGLPVTSRYRELTQHYPRPGWVEHDPLEIWEGLAACAADVVERLDQPVAAVGIANQRETVVAWDRRSGRPLHRAVVWQDRRTAGRCAALVDAGHLPLLRARTGLVADPYLSATKMSWLLEEGGVQPGPDLVLGTVDTWVAWQLTGATAGGVVVTDPTNAGRTLLYDIVERRWSEELCELFKVPMGSLAEVRPTAGRIGVTAPGVAGALAEGTPVSAIAGDQQAALFGQACFSPGMTKVTYGTGSFVLMNVGGGAPEPVDGLLTTLAWDLGTGPSPVAYALEGSIFATGAALQWLRDGLGLVGDVAEVGPLAASVDSSAGAVVVPAFTGMGSPWWDPLARGMVAGLTPGVGRAHVARACVEAMAFQVRDAVEAMAAGSGQSPSELRVDGGASVMDLLLQLQADQLRVRVTRPELSETTALGAAQLAGLAEGVWGSLDELAEQWRMDAAFAPLAQPAAADSAHQAWLRALRRARGWAAPG